MDGSNIAALEAAHGGRFRFRHAGEGYTIPGPESLKIYQILAILEQEHIPGIPNMPEWKRALVFQRWMAHYDLPDLRSLQRLVTLVERYRPQLEFDLQTVVGVDLTTAWRERRFRFLLNMIDHLPSATWYYEAVMSDPDHIDAIVKAEREAPQDEGDGKPKAPPFHTWSPELAAITDVLDAVRDVAHTVAQVQSEKKIKQPPRAPRPVSPLEEARREAAAARRLAKHRALAKRLLPHKQ
jgi:hypothetical protein